MSFDSSRFAAQDPGPDAADLTADLTAGLTAEPSWPGVDTWFEPSGDPSSLLEPSYPARASLDEAEPTYRYDEVSYGGYDEPVRASTGRHRADDDEEPAYLNPGSAYGTHPEPLRDDHDLLAQHYLSRSAGADPAEPAATQEPYLDEPVEGELRHPGLGTVERSYAEKLYPRLAASARSADLAGPADAGSTTAFDRVVQEQDPATTALQFSGPRFDPLPAAHFDAQETDFALEPLTDPEPAPAERIQDAHTLLDGGRHRAQSGALGRHRGERTSFAHSMSGRAVFATAVATALTAGGVGAAATLPTDHAETPAPKPTKVQPHSAGTTVPTYATAADRSTASGSRLAVDVSTTAPRRSTRSFANTAVKRAGKNAHPQGSAAKQASKASARPESTPAVTGAEPATAFAARKTSSAAALLRRIVLPHWVRPGTGYVSSGYGPRWGSFHYGVDLAAPYGAPIYAAGDGVVLRTGPATGFGEAIYIQHANGDVTVYGHEETTLVHPGEHVHAGQLIARVGAEGQATGPHLHFEVHKGSEYGPRVDPVPWLAARGVKL